MLFQACPLSSSENIFNPMDKKIKATGIFTYTLLFSLKRRTNYNAADWLKRTSVSRNKCFYQTERQP